MVRSPIARFSTARCWRPWALATLCAFLPLRGNAAAPQAAPHPALRIPVEPLGFIPPPRFYMSYRIPESTLGFLDANHLLFTFHVSKLMRREANDPPQDMDQTIHAVVLDLPGGKVGAQADWRLHDRDRYVWMLHDGTFLLRERDTLFISNASLTLEPFLLPQGTFIFGQLSPDGDTLQAEYANPTPEAAGDGRTAGAPTLGDDAPRFASQRQRYTMLIVDTRSRSAKRVNDLPQPIVLPVVTGGYLTAEPAKGKQWTVLLNPWKGEPRQITTVTSTCTPTLSPVSDADFLVMNCIPYSPDHLVQTFNLSGKKLWEQMWQARFVWGTFAYSAPGDRFAYGSIEMDHDLATFEPGDESNILGEPIGIFQVGDGKLDMVLNATPIMTAGENFALSPDGDKLAILRDGAIEVYDLPALKAPTPIAAAKP